MEMSTDIEIRGTRYQIGRLTARTGSWIVTQIVTKMLPFGIEGQLGTGGLPASRAEMTEADFQNIQDHCLAVCRRYEMTGSTETPMPITVRPGVFAVRELEYDLPTVLALTVQALVFNLSPFFSGDALQPILQAVTGLSSPSPSP